MGEQRVIGYAVTCRVCGMTKAPRGRSTPPAMANGLCGVECDGYLADPHPGDLWPGETPDDFGYRCVGPETDHVDDATARRLAAFVRGDEEVRRG